MTGMGLHQRGNQSSNSENGTNREGNEIRTTRHKADVPDLLIVPAGAPVLHEDVDIRRVEPLVERLREDGILKNPPVAVPVANSGQGESRRYVILDGANRTTALWRLGAPHHLVQVVDYHDVELDTWGHLVTGIAQEQFTRSLAKAGLNLDPTTPQDACERLARHEIAASVTKADGEVFALAEGVAGTQVLHQLASVYNGRSTIHRVTTDNLAELLPYHDEVTALIRFPRYTPENILYLASNGHKLPTGITRHVIPGRALRVNLPLSVLMDERQATEAKNEWLRGWISHKLADRKIRYYQEATFLFDE
jgi:hypothetical protein